MKKLQEKVPPKYMRGKRNKIAMVLIEELSNLESTTKIKPEEFYKLIDRIYALK